MTQTQTRDALFSGDLRPWSPDDSPARLLSLFHEHQAELAKNPTHRATEAYALILMTFVRMRMHQWGFVQSLHKEHLDPEDAAAACVMSLLQWSSRAKLEHPDQPKTLLALAGLRAKHFTWTLIQRARAKTATTPINSTDICVSADDQHPIARREATGDFPDLRRLERHLREIEPRALSGIYGPIDDIAAAYRLMCRGALRGWTCTTGKRKHIRRSGLPSHAELPVRLGARFTVEQHAILAPRIRRAIEEFAASTIH